MQDPDLGKLEDDAAFSKTLSEDDFVKLKVFVKNLKANAAKTRVMLSQMESQDLMIKDRVKKITNQQGSELRKVLLTA